jgi:hypothetical protein
MTMTIAAIGVASGTAPQTATFAGGTAAETWNASGSVLPGPASVVRSTISISRVSILEGATATVTLTTRDAHGIPETTGGLTVAFGLGPGNGGGTFGPVIDDGNGAYTTLFTGMTNRRTTLSDEVSRLWRGLRPLVIAHPRQNELQRPGGNRRGDLLLCQIVLGVLIHKVGDGRAAAARLRPQPRQRAGPCVPVVRPGW